MLSCRDLLLGYREHYETGSQGLQMFIRNINLIFFPTCLILLLASHGAIMTVPLLLFYFIGSKMVNMLA